MFPHGVSFRNCTACLVYIWLVMFSDIEVTGQRSTSTPPASGVVIDRATKEVKRYQDVFRNLLATETKTIRTYDKDSDMKTKRVIVSNFLVYDLSGTTGETTEFRHVLTVDGKPITNGEERAVQLFEKISRASTTSKELERIQKESLRFDERIKLYGLTLFQAIALNEAIRDVMSFEFTGKAQINGGDTYVLKYNQVKQSPLISAGGRLAGRGLLDYEFDTNGNGPFDAWISGTLWLDVESFQIVREERKLSVRGSRLPTSSLLTSNEFEFEASPFGIRTPKRISHIEYRVDRNRQSSKSVEITYEYSSFTRPDVEVLPNR